MPCYEPVTVLLVEDDAAEAHLVELSLSCAREPGFALRHATRIQDAAEALMSRPVDVVVLDLGLPDSQGLEGLARVRLAAPNAAVVVRSGLAGERIALEALEAGAQDYIVKGPADAEMLQRSILYAHARRQAEDTRRKLAGLIDSSPDAILSAGLDGAIASFNVGAERMFGYSSAEAVGRPMSMLAPADLADELQMLRDRALRGEVTRAETRLARRDGSPLEVALTVSPVIDASGRVGGLLAVARDITDSQRDRRELQAIFDNVPAPLVIRDLEGRYLQANAYVSRSLGLSPQELVGRHPSEFYAPELLSEIRAQDDALLASREPISDEITVPHGDGSMHDYHVVKYPILDAQGEVTAFGSFSLDITKRKRSEVRLRAAEERFRKTFEDAPIGMAIVAPDGRFLLVNTVLCEIVGYTEHELLALSFQDITHPDDLAPDLEYVRQMLAGEIRTYQMEKRYFNKGGDTILATLSVSLVWDQNGQPMHFVAQIEDITERRQAARAREQAFAELDEAQQIARVGSWSRDLDGDRVTWSAEMYRIFARDPESGPATGEELLGYVDEADRARVAAEYQRIVTDGGSFGVDYRIVAEDGTQRTLHGIGRRDPDRSACYIGTVQDVTQLRQAERDARRERDYAATITTSMREGFLLTHNDAIIEVNSALCRLTGFTRGELIGAPVPYPFWAPEAVEEIQRHRQTISAGASAELETTYVRKDGTRVEVSINAVPATLADGEPCAYVSTIRDITEQKRHRAELERLATRDPLTDLLNHRIFHEQLRGEIARAARHHRPLSLVVLDLDNFKDINDRHGHPTGDKVLQEAARRIQAVVREGEFVARVGGEEFGWILPDATSTGAYVAAERARNAIAATPFPGVGIVTVSAGVSQLTDENLDAQRLYELADQALYDAKQQGRNRTGRYHLGTDTCTSRPDGWSWIEAAGERADISYTSAVPAIS